MNTTGVQMPLDPASLRRNPNNPRRYFNDEHLDLLRTSLQEVGILVPLIAYEDSSASGEYVLMDGERRWRCALDLAFDSVPAMVIPEPSPLENLLRMFNIHSVREEWPLISVALSIREVIEISGEEREGRLAEMTGLTRSTVRRAKKLLTLPDTELDLIRNDAHLDRTEQVHREDLYLEIIAATSVISNSLPEVAERYESPQIIRSFAEKREKGTLRAVTEFRDVGKLVKASEDALVGRSAVTEAVDRLIEDVEVTPSAVFNEIAAAIYEQQTAARKAELLQESLDELAEIPEVSPTLRGALERLRSAIDQILGESDG
jgi:ParB family transcriptional regulator, chromosome partitioning protein